MKVLYLILNGTDAATVAELVTSSASEILEFGSLGIGTQLVECVPGLHLIDVRRACSDALPEVRSQLTRFVAEWPNGYQVGERSFKAWLRRDGGLLWWLMELSQKNLESSRTLQVLCHAEVLRRQLARQQYTRTVVVGGDLPLVKVFGAVCRQAGMPFAAHATTRIRGTTFSGRVWARARSAAGALLKTWFARRLAVSQSASPEGSLRVAFLTWCPAQWVDVKDRPRDRYFVDLPGYLQGKGAAVLYVGSLWGVRAGGLREAVRQIRGFVGGLQQEIVWMESFSSWWSILKLYLDVKVWLQTEWRARRDRDLARSLAAQPWHRPVARARAGSLAVAGR